MKQLDHEKLDVFTAAIDFVALADEVAESLPRGRACTERGIALLVVMLAMALFMALGSALVLTTTTETRIWARYRRSAGAIQIADAAVARAIVDLRQIGDWSALPAGGVLSTFTDGAPGGVRTLPGLALNLTALTNVARCGKPDACDDAGIAQAAEDRPWGRTNPHWQLYLYGPASMLIPDAPAASSQYVVVWIGDDPSETDGNPLVDGGPPEGGFADDNPGRSVLRLLAHGYSAGDVHAAIEVTVRKTAGGVWVEAWRDR